MIQFEIEYVMQSQDRYEVHIFAKQINVGVDWKLTEMSKLGNVPIKPYSSIPRKLDVYGHPRYDIFVFILKHKTDKNRLIIGDIVELTEVDTI